MQKKLFAQLISAEKIEKIISCKSNEKKKNDTSFVMKMRYNQMSKNVITQKNESIKMS